VSAETLYQSLYVQARGGLRRELTAYVRAGRSMRKPRRRQGERRSRFPAMVLISERPEVEDRASNENTTGLLRQYLPKGTDLSFYGPGMLDNIAAELNSRPRKRHAFQTPAEVLEQLPRRPQRTTVLRGLNQRGLRRRCRRRTRGWRRRCRGP